MCFMPILTQIGLKNLLASFEFDVFLLLASRWDRGAFLVPKYLKNYERKRNKVWISS